MPSKPTLFSRGFRHTLPLAAGAIPFGVLYATLAGAAGFPGWLTLLCSVAIFGGSSQVVFVDLFQHLASPLQAALGSNIVNARHLIYSAGVSRHFSLYALRWRLLLCYLLTDQLYAIAQAREEEIDALAASHAPWYYFGSGFCTWALWMASTGLGVLFGSIVPRSWNLGFSVPLLFMPLIFAVSKTRYAYFTSLTAAVLAFFLRNTPYGLGIFASVLLATFAGFLAFAKSGRAG